MTYAKDATPPFYHGTRADLQVGDLLAPGLRLQLSGAEALLDLLLRHTRRGDLGL